MLAELDGRIIETKVKKKCGMFRRLLVAGARNHTEWRNSISHKVKSVREREERDKKLRTMFEATSDLLVEWLKTVQPLKLDV
jgi:hypothetical protein